MQKPNIKKVLAAFLLGVVMFLGVAEVAKADGATVLNHPDGAFCTINTRFGVFYGQATIVINDNICNIQCNAEGGSLPKLPQRAKKLRVGANSPCGSHECLVIVSPSGRANLSCHVKF